MNNKISLSHEHIDSLRYSIQNSIIELHEFLYTCDPDETARLRDKLADLYEPDLTPLAWSLHTSELKYMCEILSVEKDAQVIRRASEILKLRQTKNLFVLAWYYFTENVTNRNLWNILEAYSPYMTEKHKKFFETTLYFKLKDKFETFDTEAAGMLKNDGANMTAFLEKYMIMQDTRLAHRLDMRLFCSCSKEIIQLNSQYMVIKKEMFKNRAIAANYLDKQEILDYSNVIVNYIEQRHFAKSEFFRRSITPAAREKYERWDRMWHIMLYLGNNTPKTNVWWAFSENIRKVDTHSPDNGLFIHFDEFVVIIPDPDGSELYLYKKNEFHNRYEVGGASGRIGTGDRNIALSARDAILNDKHANIYIMSFENVNLLYLRDLITRELESPE